MKNIILIGAGGIGRRHIKAYLATNRATISIVEPDNDKVSSIKNDFKIVGGQQEPHDYTISFKLASEKVYFNVEGFVKNKFLLTIYSLDSKKSQVGELNISITKMGRDFKHSYELALRDIKLLMIKNIGELKID